MASVRLTRTLTRIASAVTVLGLAAAVVHSALAAPGHQNEPVIDQIRQQVSQVRGLEVKAEAPVTPIERPTLISKLSRELNAERTIREFLTSQMLLEVLGAMPRGFDLRQLQLRLLEEQTTAVYDYDDRAIYLVSEAAGDIGANERLVLAHEMTHALQDQHFGLRRILPANPQNSDADTAARALVEGDAMLTMRIWGRQFLRPSDKRALGDESARVDPVLESAPPLVRGELLFPYDAGWVFAQLLYQDGGYDAVNKALLSPPRSTEQILHPEKYLAGEQPVTVTLEPVERTLGGTWKTLRTDTFGELVLRLLLEPGIGWADAEAAAAGWGGDAYTILEDGSGKRVVGMVTTWDTDEDASEMYNAFVANLEAQYRASAVRTLNQSGLIRWTTPEYAVQAIKTGNVVRIAFAPDDATLSQVEVVLSEAVFSAAGPVVPRPAGTSAPGPAPSPQAIPTVSASPTAQPAATVTITVEPSAPAEPMRPAQPDEDADEDD